MILFAAQCFPVFFPFAQHSLMNGSQNSACSAESLGYRFDGLAVDMCLFNVMCIYIYINKYTICICNMYLTLELIWFCSYYVYLLNELMFLAVFATWVVFLPLSTP